MFKVAFGVPVPSKYAASLKLGKMRVTFLETKCSSKFALQESLIRIIANVTDFYKMIFKGRHSTKNCQQTRGSFKFV